MSHFRILSFSPQCITTCFIIQGISVNAREMRSGSMEREKGRDLTQSNDQSPYNRKVNKGKATTQNATKISITQQLRTNLGRSVGQPPNWCG